MRSAHSGTLSVAGKEEMLPCNGRLTQTASLTKILAARKQLTREGALAERLGAITRFQISL